MESPGLAVSVPGDKNTHLCNQRLMIFLNDEINNSGDFEGVIGG